MVTWLTRLARAERAHGHFSSDDLQAAGEFLPYGKMGEEFQEAVKADDLPKVSALYYRLRLRRLPSPRPMEVVGLVQPRGRLE